YKGDDRETFPNQLYIQPEECIDCGACEPECPWEAIYEDASVPEVFEEDTVLNANMMEVQDDFEVPVHDDIEQPTPEQVEENKKKWGFGG
ncbi:MAG: 4Fe-4S binding protein, partial [Myxococcales bacterium]|nr:4Fe-4S binding protein [Myxococcales bacterium]